MKDVLTSKNKAGIIYSLFICLHIIFSGVAQTILLTFTDENTFVFRVVYSLFSIFSLWQVIVSYSQCNKTNIIDVANIKNCKYIYFGIAILFFVAIYFGLGLVNGIIATFIQNLGLRVSSSYIVIENVFQLVGYIVVIGILIPISEESFFRGVLLNGTKEYSIVFSVLFSSLCFAIYHGSIAQLVYQFVYGVFLGLIAYSAKSILPTILSHSINNIVVLLFMYFNIDTTFINEKWFVILIGIILLIAIFVYLVYVNKGKDKNKGKSTSGVWLYSLFGIGLMMLTIILNMVA